jgi:hypothetical protein
MSEKRKKYDREFREGLSGSSRSPVKSAEVVYEG